MCRCAIFDLDDSKARIIDAADTARYKLLRGHPPEPKCASCPLTREAGALRSCDPLLLIETSPGRIPGIRLRGQIVAPEARFSNDEGRNRTPLAGTPEQNHSSLSYPPSARQ